MHTGNRLFWLQCRQRYEPFFRDVSVIECGSLDHNGSVGDFFWATKKYVGVDWRAGPRVDLVSLIHEIPGDEQYDTVVSASLLEHDPYWEKSLTRMVQLMAPQGAMFLTWGAAKNPEHCKEDAPDGEFHALPAGRVLRLLAELGVYVHEFLYEMTLSKLESEAGCVALVAFKDPSLAVGERSIATLDKEDEA